MRSKMKVYADHERLRAVGRSRGYIFKDDLLAAAGVKPTEEFRVLATARRIVFEYSQPAKSGRVGSRPLSYYLTKHVAEKAPAQVDEIWPDKSMVLRDDLSLAHCLPHNPDRSR